MSSKNKKVDVNGTEIVISIVNNEEYISLTDIARYKDSKRTDYIIQNWMRKRHNWDIETHNITLVSGVVAALSAAVEAYSDINDEVIIQPPVYYPFFSVVKHNDRKLIENPLINDNGDYKMDLK